MEINEVMENEEVIETAEEVVKTSSGKAFKVAAGIGLAVLTGVIVYKYVKPIVAAKRKHSEEAPEPAEQKVVETAAETDGSGESNEETTVN